MSRLTQKSLRRGFTLLELLLALSLTAVVLLIVATGITVQFRAFNNGRTRVERAQLARVLLHRMADDLRGALPPGTASSGTSSGEGTATTASTQTASDASASTAADTTLAGAYGELDWLRIDVARAVKSESNSSDGAASTDATTQSLRQIATIVYYAVSSDEAAAGPMADDDSQQSGGGLVRRELVRPVAVWAAQYGSIDYRDLSLSPLASEVAAVEFRYHDGSDWLESWDSATAGTLPKAIEIRLFLTPVSNDQMRSSSTTGASQSADESLNVQYRLVVPMPFEGPVESGGSGSSPSSSTDSSSTPEDSPSTDSGDETGPTGDTP